MNKTINFELSKRLTDLGLLDNIETEFVNITDWSIHERDWEPNPQTYTVATEELLYGLNFESTKYNNLQDIINDKDISIEINYKTLTLEEAIEFLDKDINWWNIMIWKFENQWHIEYNDDNFINTIDATNFWDTLLEAIEKMIKCLLDNNLLWIENKK